ncbi:hypothetical protein [Nitratireductor soli]|uniref:hypothetical protein n=1 Tax=Nitratireductor soli TaxID=1670619 RepID=UPI00065E26E0|nr:hypothetical protein [Nitratireductor soli]
MAVHLRREEATLSLIVAEPATGDDETRYIAALHEIAVQECPFVLRVAFDKKLELEHEYRKEQNLWFKASRQQMNAMCRAVAIVRRDPSPEMQRIFSGLWAFPVLVTRSHQEAEDFLAGHRPAEARA